MQRHALNTRVETIRGPLKPLNTKLERQEPNEKTPLTTSKKKFNSPPSIMIDKKGKTTFTLGRLLGEVSLFFLYQIGWFCSMLSG